MLNNSTAKAVIDHALFLGADFAELFVERHHSGSVELLSGEVDKVNSGIDFGIGIRLFFGHKVLYGYTNSQDEEKLKQVTSLLCAKDKRDQIAQADALNFTQRNDRHPVSMPFSANNHVEEKI